MENENVIPFDLKLSIFPTFENTYPGSIPSLMVSKSKYSSTESDLFSSDDNKSVTTMDLLRPTLSGFSVRSDNLFFKQSKAIPRGYNTLLYSPDICSQLLWIL